MPGFHYVRLALTCILNGKTDNFLCLVGMVCSSFVTINKGTNKRYPYDALGDHAVSSVSQGNQLATRCLDVKCSVSCGRCGVMVPVLCVCGTSASMGIVL